MKHLLIYGNKLRELEETIFSQEMMMKNFSQVMLVLVSMFSFAHCAMAESQKPRAEKPADAKPGTRYSFVNGVMLIKCNRWEVKEVNVQGEIVSKCGENSLYIKADSSNVVMAVNDKGETVAKFTPFYPGLSFPLFVGKKWSGKYDGHLQSLDYLSGDVTCESTAFEEVQVAAGKFGAFRIECTDKWDSGVPFINGTSKSTKWYAPSIGMTIKSTNDDSNWDFELAGGDWR